MKVPPRSLVAGMPAKVKRELSDAEIAWKLEGTMTYQELTGRCLESMMEVAPLAAIEKRPSTGAQFVGALADCDQARVIAASRSGKIVSRQITGVNGMPRGRASTYDEQRDMILERAAALFAKRGYPSTSMNQVAEACNLSKATLYHYYRDKYSLLLSIADGHVSRLAALVEDEQALALHGEARLRHLIHRIVEEYADAQDAHRVLTEDVKFLEPDDRERVLDKDVGWSPDSPALYRKCAPANPARTWQNP